MTTAQQPAAVLQQRQRGPIQKSDQAWIDALGLGLGVVVVGLEWSSRGPPITKRERYPAAVVAQQQSVGVGRRSLSASQEEKPPIVPSRSGRCVSRRATCLSTLSLSLNDGDARGESGSLRRYHETRCIGTYGLHGEHGRAQGTTRGEQGIVLEIG